MADSPILVTGASGLLGANLSLTAQQCGNDVVAVYHQHKLASSTIETVRVDLTDASAVSDLLKSRRPAWIIHCAALTDVEWCETHITETYQINTELPQFLAKRARQIEAKMVYISTDSVFDGRKGKYAETDSPNPINTYAKSKLNGEIAVQAELDSALIVRTNIYGWNTQPKYSLAEWMLTRLETGQVLPGFSDVIFSPILANDLASIILDLMDKKLAGVYHLGASQSCSKYEFAVKLAEVFNLNRALVQPTKIDKSLLKTLRPKNTSLNTEKAFKALDRRMPDITEGLQNFKGLRNNGFVSQLKKLTGA